MQRHPLAVCFAVMITLTTFVPMGVTGDEPFSGTWTLNLAKSTFSTPTPPLRSLKAKIEAHDNSIKAVIDGVDSSGGSLHYAFEAKFDGKDYPFTGDPGVDTVALTRIDGNTFDILWKKAGKEAGSAREAVSKDGRTWTETEKMKEAKGQERINIYVYNKQ